MGSQRARTGLFAAHLRPEKTNGSLALRQLHALACRVSTVSLSQVWVSLSISYSLVKLKIVIDIVCLPTAMCSLVITSIISFKISKIRIVHIAMNILIQLLLGIPLELVHKGWRIMLVYILGALIGGLAHSVTDFETMLW